MRKSSDALENMQRWAATDYRLAGSGVESDCKKQRCISFRVLVFNYFSLVFPGIEDFSASTDDAVDGGITSDQNCRARIVVMRIDIPTIAKTLLFTVFVPGTVAGYVPWRFRQHAGPVTGPEECAADHRKAIGLPNCLITAALRLRFICRCKPAPISATQKYLGPRLHP